jgi:excisionase family DNA binding protein
VVPRPAEEDGDLGKIVTALERAVASAAPASLPAILGALEKLKALAWARAADPAGGPSSAADPLDELRHLTPLQVAELLNLKEAYVHELCRSGRIPAIKERKYWIIPVAGLREWLGQCRRRIDPRSTGSVPLLGSLGPRLGNEVAPQFGRRRGAGPAQLPSSTRRTARRGLRRSPRRVAPSAKDKVSAMEATNHPELLGAPSSTASPQPAAP